VRARFLASPDRSEIEVVTKELSGNIRTQQATARGGVRLAQTAGAAGITDSAKVDGTARLASGEDPVDVVGDGYRIHAERGFALDFNDPGKLSLLGPIETTLGGLP